MTEIKNLTPHPIYLLDESNNIIRTFMPDGLARLKANTVDAGFTVDGCRVTTTQFGEAEGLPQERKVTECHQSCRGDYDEGGFACPSLDGDVCLKGYNENTFYIVSQLIKSAFPNRKDLLVPAEVVRDNNGNIIGCRSLGI